MNTLFTSEDNRLCIETWDKCLQIISNSVSSSVFNSWFAPIIPLKIDGYELTVQVPSKHHVEYLEENFVDLFKKALSNIIGPKARLTYVFDPKDTSLSTPDSDKRRILVKIDTERNINLVQPNVVTFSKHSFTAWQQNFLILVIDNLQVFRRDANDGDPCIILDYRGRGEVKQSENDLLCDPSIIIDCSEIGGKNNKFLIMKEIEKLKSKDIEFSYFEIIEGKKRKITSKGNLITLIEDVENTSNIRVEISPWGLPFLLKDRGMGFTRFNKEVALELNTANSKRMYDIISSQERFGMFKITVEDFREMLELGEAYTPNKIKIRVLSPSQEEIEKSNSIINFDFKLLSEKKSKIGKSKADTIKLDIYEKGKRYLDVKDINDNDFYKFREVKEFLAKCIETKKKQIDIEDLMCTIYRERYLDKIYGKLEYYKKQKMLTNKIQNIILKVLKEDYNITI